MTDDEILVDIIKIRSVGSSSNSPIIITLPRDFVEKCGIVVGQKKRIYTDGKKICIDDYEKPKL